MQRIGIAASKIAKGNFFLYNFFVILITFLFSLLILFIAGSSIVVALIIMAYVTSAGALPDLQKGRMPIVFVCLRVLATVIALLALSAIIVNVKFKKHE